MSGVDVGKLVDWFADREGDKVYLEIGVPDPDVPKGDRDLFVAKIHDLTLGKVDDASDDQGRGNAIMVWFASGKADRIFIVPSMITDLQINAHGVRIEMFDRSVYIGLVPSLGGRKKD